MASNLGELLLREKLITAEQLKDALGYEKKNKVSTSSALVALGYISEEEMAQALSRQMGYPYIDLGQFEVYPDVINLIPADIAKKNMIMPIHRIRSFLTMAMVDPTDLDIIENVRFRTSLSIQPVIASESGITDAINKYYGSSDALKVKEIIDEIEQAEDSSVNVIEEQEEEYSIEELVHSTEEAPVITLVNTIFVDAVKKGASDVHFEAYEKSFRVRYRIDGILHEMMDLAMKFKNPVISRVKVLSNLDIAEKRLPQDGRLKMRVKIGEERKEVDMRISSVPTMFGEKIVSRILDKGNLQLDLAKLGFEKKTLDIFQKAIKRPWGIILVTGPTGSGKTNTLYSAISNLNSQEKNIMTAEDPVEFYMAGINQVHIREEIGLSFSSALRAFLRQDPDIMLIGEMRDYETVDIAIKAALTGHLVFSTVHTNDAASTIVRLINMNVEPFLIADSLALVVAQRLIRRLCKKCKEEQKISPEALVDIGFTPEEAKEVKVFKAAGCGRCNDTGYKGRVGLFEVMEMDDELKTLILAKALPAEIKKEAMGKGMLTLRGSGLCKIKEGVTTIEEVLRETIRDSEVEV
ncbi:MAG: type IV-A pilus assembly ATPase PilB [Candidatus Aminicenantes bacterium]|nr:type IV-A pilus assembly ATPase PilB [Candidatus Aminicenantes bacterium]